MSFVLLGGRGPGLWSAQGLVHNSESSLWVTEAGELLASVEPILVGQSESSGGAL